MVVKVVHENLTISLSPIETIYSWRRKIVIPIQDIISISTDEPQSSWLDLRAPGAYFPGYIKAGTYFTKRGREFWYVVRKTKGNYLNINLRNSFYHKIVISFEGNTRIAKKIEAKLSDKDYLKTS